ncbi:YHS domain-containing protein [Gillisia sp. Hel_I_29]|uniref:YHS domain-containing protein n=1 Tax=Gillisia sp. Hel_I_29 TaxID=1249975 RepID=UPI000555529E|nr:YHS domain-containing protein [Gillisia sp. Hel_I_29]
MKTIICSTCGCSLVRLGVSKNKASTTIYNGNELYFCCDGCTDLFKENPEKYIEETKDLIVCPTCLAEKPRAFATMQNINEQDIYFCHCPHCMNLYKKDPEFYIDRLKGNTPSPGILGHDGCCIAPD